MGVRCSANGDRSQQVSLNVAGRQEFGRNQKSGELRLRCLGAQHINRHLVVNWRSLCLLGVPKDPGIVRAIDAIHLLAHPKDDECRERFRRNMTSRYISRRVNVKQTASEIPPLL